MNRICPDQENQGSYHAFITAAAQFLTASQFRHCCNQALKNCSTQSERDEIRDWFNDLINAQNGPPRKTAGQEGHDGYVRKWVTNQTAVKAHKRREYRGKPKTLVKQIRS